MLTLKPFIYDFTLCFGKKGSGKTSNLAKLAYHAHKLGHTVYCTEENIAYTYHLPYDQIGHVWLEEDSLLLIDEIATLFNSRDFKTTPKAVRDYFRYTRHNRIKVVSYSQQFNDVDLQIRSMADDLLYVTRIGRNLSMYRKIEKTIEFVTNPDGQGIIAESYKKVGILHKGALSFCSLKRYRKYFDSYSRLAIPDIDNSRLVYTDYIPPEKKKRLTNARNACSRVVSKVKLLFKKKNAQIEIID